MVSDDLTVLQLKSLAKSLKLSGYNRPRKKDLIEFINKHLGIPKQKKHKKKYLKREERKKDKKEFRRIEAKKREKIKFEKEKKKEDCAEEKLVKKREKRKRQKQKQKGKATKRGTTSLGFHEKGGAEEREFEKIP